MAFSSLAKAISMGHGSCEAFSQNRSRVLWCTYSLYVNVLSNNHTVWTRRTCFPFLTGAWSFFFDKGRSVFAQSRRLRPPAHCGGRRDCTNGVDIASRYVQADDDMISCNTNAQRLVGVIFSRWWALYRTGRVRWLICLCWTCFCCLICQDSGHYGSQCLEQGRVMRRIAAIDVQLRVKTELQRLPMNCSCCFGGGSLYHYSTTSWRSHGPGLAGYNIFLQQYAGPQRAQGGAVRLDQEDPMETVRVLFLSRECHRDLPALYGFQCGGQSVHQGGRSRKTPWWASHCVSAKHTLKNDKNYWWTNRSIFYRSTGTFDIFWTLCYHWGNEATSFSLYKKRKPIFSTLAQSAGRALGSVMNKVKHCGHLRFRTYQGYVLCLTMLLVFGVPKNM